MTDANGTNGIAWVASTSTRAPTAAARSRIASRSASRPVCIWTRLSATSVVRGPISSGSRSKATSRTVAPRSRATRIGKSTDVNSSAGTTTSSAGPSAAAIRPTPTDAAGWSDTRSGVVPIRCANDDRAASAGRSQSACQSAVPACQASIAARMARIVGSGGRP